MFNEEDLQEHKTRQLVLPGLSDKLAEELDLPLGPRLGLPLADVKN